MEARYIKAYRGVFSPTLCDNLIKTYEKLWIEQEEYLKSISLCYNQDGVKKCGACDCQRLDIMQHKEFNEPFKLVISDIQNIINQYKKDVNLHRTQWPSKYGFEHLRIKR